MEASVLDLRRRMSEIIRALDNNEPVIILYRGKKKGVIYPAGKPGDNVGSAGDHPAFGMWNDRKDMKDVEKYVRGQRKGRGNAF